MKAPRLSILLKHLFIPHEANDYKPHFFRELTMAIVLVSSIFLLGVSVGSSFFLHKTVLGASVTASVLVDFANETRLAYNEPLLTRNTLLDKAAQLKGEDMSNRGYFSHNSPDGITPWHWFDQVGYIFTYAGENLAVNFFESEEVQNAWLNSPKHKDNLLNKNFKEIGIATVGGIYKNAPTIFVVQMFGSQASVTATKEITVVATSTPKEERATTTNVSSSTLIQTTSIPEDTNDNKKTPSVTKASQVKEEVIQNIFETPELIIVKNTKENREGSHIVTGESIPIYAPWYGKYLFESGNYVDTLYKTTIATIFIALLVMILIEIKKQHYKHISYGLVVLIILIFLVHLNKPFIS